ncbi:outer membrane protein assembly factor BamE [Pseudooceanicola nanhaiensis]|jgi:outer membrane protein assembly factor BamE (lipoprotein component of BamABCDE complex)|uniref:Outer membrane protein assembly factor BamE n=2 Tax=Pseudooceanicola nanhaiensis TaxID=375761 RepID=A0A917SPM8_9RHOB|nr:outer membrane protein assembly factor BamE [Pseudooceanicola nanhaiensis]
MSGMTKRFALTAAAAVLAVGVACSPIYQDHGYVPLERELRTVQVGADTRETVKEKLGDPSTGGVVSDGDYYWVRSRMRTIGPAKPEVIEREVVAVSFDSAGRVANVERFGLEQGRVVPISRRVTSSSTANKGFLRQLLGNLGRFNAGDFIGG